MRQIQIMLAKEIPNLGKRGETVWVKPGYFRNFLGPTELAVPVGSQEAQKILSSIKERQEEKTRATEIKREKKVKQEQKHKVMKAQKEKLLRKK